MSGGGGQFYNTWKRKTWHPGYVGLTGGVKIKIL